MFIRSVFFSLCIVGLIISTNYGYAESQHELKQVSVEKLIGTLKSSDGSERVRSSAELLSRGPAVLPALEQAGAKPLISLNASRLDVIYSLIKGLPASRQPSLKNDGYTTIRYNSFGLISEPTTQRQEIDEMGKRYGFILPAAEKFNHMSNPNCYVTISPGYQLLTVLKLIMINEPKIISINLNYTVS